MKKSDIIRALRNEQYRDSLSAAEQAGLPNHPAGMVEIEDADLAAFAGGTWWSNYTGCQSCVTRDCNTCYSTSGSGCCC